MVKLLYAGFDGLDISFQGALPRETLDLLDTAKKQAAELRDPQLRAIGPGKVKAHVQSHGMKGGYAFVLDTGPLGEIWFFMDNSDPRNWNVSVSVRAAALATNGYHATKRHLLERLAAMGCRIAQESIRRVDFAMDFLMPESFELKLDQVVAHSHAKLAPYWSDKANPEGSSELTTNKPSAVLRGRKLETVTVGKMPGRQVTIYNKRKAAIEQRKLFWFKIWDIPQSDPTANIWRVELRAGKAELKKRWQLSTFADFEASIGDVYTLAAEKVRYLDDFQTDGNISRQRQHPLWDAVQETLQQELLEFRAGLLPDQVKAVNREQLIETYFQQIVGNAASLSVALGLEEEEIREHFCQQIAQTLSNKINDPDATFWESRGRAEQRLCFQD